MAFIPNFREKISQIVKYSHKFLFICTRLVLAFSVFLTDLCSISLIYSCRLWWNLGNIRAIQGECSHSHQTVEAIVSVSLQYPKNITKWTQKLTKFLKFINVQRFVGIPVIVWYHHTQNNQLSRVMRKPTFCICENKDADQLCGNRTMPLFSLQRIKESLYFLNTKFQASGHLR